MNEQTLSEIVAQIKANYEKMIFSIREEINGIVNDAAPVWITGDAKKIFEELNGILGETGPVIFDATNQIISLLNQKYKDMLYITQSNVDPKVPSLMEKNYTLIVEISKIKEYNGGILGTEADLLDLKSKIAAREKSIEEMVKALSSTIAGLAEEFFSRIGDTSSNMQQAIQSLYDKLLDGFAKLFHILDSDDRSLTKAIQECIDKYNEAKAAIANSVSGVNVN